MCDLCADEQVLRQLGVTPDRPTFMLIIEVCARAIEGSSSGDSHLLAGIVEGMPRVCWR